MKVNKLKIGTSDSKYEIIIGQKILKNSSQYIKKSCPNVKKIALVIDKNIPQNFVNILKTSLKKFKVYSFKYSVNEKFKSTHNALKLAETCLAKNFNRNDLIISFGGGILGDLSGFASSIIKRGINFINIPSTLLAQVDSSIGGKTGVNSKFGKNLIGTFYQPKLVISDVELLKSLPKREMVCGYAEILKHSMILKSNFFSWLSKNSAKILENKNPNLITQAIVKSCKVKLYFVEKDTKEKNIRMILNFGHTFAHAIEVQNKYSKNINHGEAVILGMLMATKLSYLKGVCSLKTLNLVQNIYKNNNLKYSLDKFFKTKEYNSIVDHMSNDKKNNDDRINLILLKSIGQTTLPNSYKIKKNELKKIFKKII